MTVEPDPQEQSFLTRAHRAWWWSPSPTATPVLVGADRAAELVAASAGSDRREPEVAAPSGTTAEVPDGATLFSPFTGAVREGRLVVEGVDQQLVQLTPADVTALSAADHDGRWTGPADDPLGARLAGAGLLVLPVPTRGEPVHARDELRRQHGVVGPRVRHDLPGLEGPEGRVQVYAPWFTDVGPVLALGMLTAAARHFEGGRLNQTYRVHVPSRSDEVLEHMAQHRGPAVLLCSDYIWTIEQNLELARAARALCPQLVVVHGGPSSPKFEADAAEFLAAHPDAADVLVRGEGEATFLDLLDRLAPGWPAPDLSVLADCEGLTFRDPATGGAVRTPDRDRIADLDTLPSPYLTGEFDHIDADAWLKTTSVETTRGCPYGCTFCDWGSATMSRIRKFDLDRVGAELDWAAERGIASLNIPDANFGIMSRDVEVARKVAEVHDRTGFPKYVSYYPAKNTTKHLANIMDVLNEVGLAPSAPLSLQSTDATTLDTIARSNISNEHFVALAAEFRRRRFPLQGELILGLPGQTVDSYTDDLQFLLDHEITPRTWPLQVLPNAPMNDPEYRALHQITVDEHNIVQSTATAGPAERARMLRIRNGEIVAERYGLLRHVLRYLQWDHGRRAMDVVTQVLDVTSARPDDYPLLAWTTTNFDLHPGPALGWTAFYEETHRFVMDELGVPDSSALRSVLHLQQFLMPAPGREFPCSTTLDHDYVAYYRSATDDLYRDGRAHGPSQPLSAFGPARFTVTADPLTLCVNGLEMHGDSRNEQMPGDWVIGANSAFELESPLLRYLPWVAAVGIEAVLPDDLGEGPDREDPVPEPPEAVRVQLGPR